MKRMRWLVLVCACACAIAAPHAAHASPLFELLGASDAGFAGRAMVSNARAAYFNPALLVEAQSGLSVEYVFLLERLDVEVGARECEDSCDVPIINGAGPESFRHEDGALIEQPTLPTAWLEEGRDDKSGVVLAARPRQAAATGRDEHGYLGVGLVQAPLPDRFAYGVSLLLPLQGFMQTRAFYADEREQLFSNSVHHELYGDRLQSAGLAFGAGVRLTQRLTLGASFTLSIASAANAPVYVPSLADLDTLLVDSDVSVSTHIAPHLGLALIPLPQLRLTATVHSPQGTTIDTSFSYVIATGIEQRASQRFEHAYLPWTFGLGAELTLGEPEHVEWQLGLSTTYALWSDYKDRHGDAPSDRYAWSDLFDAALTLRARAQALSGFVSGTYEPTPVPSQTGRSNYADSARLGAALGVSYAFELLELPLSVALEGQLHRVVPRDTRKEPDLLRDEVPDDAVGGTPRGPIEGREGLQTNNPGFPSFNSEGWLAALGARLSLAY
jgi:hypothetical protein